MFLFHKLNIFKGGISIGNSNDSIKKAREMDLLTYLKYYEPYELKRVSRKVYSTRTHDSLKISNGRWMWWSRGIGGKSALDYLIKSKECNSLMR